MAHFRKQGPQPRGAPGQQRSSHRWEGRAAGLRGTTCTLPETRATGMHREAREQCRGSQGFTSPLQPQDAGLWPVRKGGHMAIGAQGCRCRIGTLQGTVGSHHLSTEAWF